jgi:predicted HD superfamily hydrolase involved in NAD metabolism
LLHAALGADMLEESYGIKDPDIKQAIRFHTVGGAGMSKLDKIIYLADMIEPGRDFPELAILRRLAEENLDQAMLLAFNQSMQFVLKKNSIIHPDTVLARNEILLKG